MKPSEEMVHAITRSDQVTKPFSLTCRDCDAGMEIQTPEQAIAAGWTGIEEAFDLAEANYLGSCPDHRD